MTSEIDISPPAIRKLVATYLKNKHGYWITADLYNAPDMARMLSAIADRDEHKQRKRALPASDAASGREGGR